MSITIVVYYCTYLEVTATSWQYQNAVAINELGKNPNGIFEVGLIANVLRG